MTRSLLTALAVAACALLPASALADGPSLSKGGDAEFPHRSFLLSLPSESSVAPGDVHVVENGSAVHDLAVTPAGSSAAGELGTVLVIDASNSMRGGPIRRAMAAARAFAEHRRPEHELGIVTFNDEVRTLLAPTTDDAAIDAALAEAPALAKQTHVRDGAMAGLEVLETADIRVGSVVVLSDGADTGSGATVAQIASAARDRGVRVFTVGLESERFDQRSLVRLAEASDGEYSVAASADELDRIYNQLGARLAEEYLVEYSSVAGPGKRVTVQATAEGIAGTATLNYRSPKIVVAAQPPVEPKATGLWGSAAAMVIVGFGAAFLVCFAVASILLAKRQTESPEERVAAFVAMGEQAGESSEETRSDFYDRVESRLSGNAVWRQFSMDVEIAQITRQPGQIAVVTALATLLIMWLFTAISGVAWMAVFALITPWGVRKFVGHRAHKQRILFGEQLADNLQVIASAMRAGMSFAGALAVAVEDAPEPAHTEFKRVVADDQLGVPLERSLGAVVERMDNRDLHQVTLVATLQREAGGNSAEVLDRVAGTIRERVSLRRLVSTLTAQGRLARWIVSAVPIGLVMFIGLVNAGYLSPLFDTTFGNVMFVIAALMMFAGFQAMKKIADIKV